MSPTPRSGSDLAPEPLHLFSATGVELEYMLVDAETLAVAPRVDDLFRRALGRSGPTAAAVGAAGAAADVEHEDISWSNELALHVVELKTSTPAPSLGGLARTFQDHVGRVESIAADLGARLLPTAMHPLMDPLTETRLWPHEYGPVYRTYDRIFGCRGHGWSNLQSAHLNFPFANAEEFGRLHAAIRVLLPLLPAIAASSPVAEGQVTGFLDTRMEHYRTNSRRIPSVAGRVVPEPVFDPDLYGREILERMYADVAPLDPEGTLRGEFLNSRGAIARFDRGAIEIRVIDVQECPLADLAIAWVTRECLRSLVREERSTYAAQCALETEALAGVLHETIVSGDTARVTHAPLLRALGFGSRERSAGDVWCELVADLARSDPEDALDSTGAGAGASATGETGATVATVATEAAEYLPVARRLLDRGCLARRILEETGRAPTTADCLRVWRRLADCLRAGEIFE